MASEHVSPFGERLRYWRRRAGYSQLELAARAETTPRHLSFVETGRSRPGSALVLRLAAALDVPIRERNSLLVAAGLTPIYPARKLSDAPMSSVQRVLDALLRSHPWPAWVIGPGLRFVGSNRASEALFPGLCALSPSEIVDLWLGPGPFRERIDNWSDIGWTAVASLRREAERSDDPALRELLARAEAHIVGLSPPSDPSDADLPVLCPRFKFGDQVIRTISTVLRFDTAIEVTTSELRVELMFPADDLSEAALRRLCTPS
jgi:transcriptional regulator with XRE-family HTH domain